MSRKHLFFKVSGFLLGILFSFFTIFIGLIFIACSENEQSKKEWKIFTKFSMLGVAAMMMVSIVSCVAATVYVYHSVNTKNQIGDDCSSNNDCDDLLVCRNGKCSFYDL
jgi:hypothetical protein